MTIFEPYPYQQKVAELILMGQNVILQAPTGSGKTAAALLPYLHSQRHLTSKQFPQKCIYSVPMRVLAKQFEYEYKKLLIRNGWDDKLKVTIQTGDRPEDPKLEGDLIFTTIDQTLSNFLCIPYALSNRQANLNAGAVVSSYLVFDEFHLFPPQALETTLSMLKMLKGVTPFLLMTATFSATMLTDLGKQLEAVIVPQPDDEQAHHALQALPSQQKERRYFTVQQPLNAEAVLQHHPKKGNPRSIAICNTVQRAQDLFEALKHKAPPGVTVKLLHSRFLKEDRDAKENWLRNEFGKNKSQYQTDNAILVATQVVEVGLDITCDALHTELAPANAVLQRAGRCARYAGETGQVYIYQLPEREGKNGEAQPNYAPYLSQDERETCDKGWAAFSQKQGQSFTFIDEQHLLTEAHGAADSGILQKLSDNRHTHRQMVQAAMGYQERGLASDLIRDVNSRNVIVHPDPNSDTRDDDPSRLKNPWRWQSFSLFAGSVNKAFKDLQALTDEIDHDEWVMMVLHQPKPEGLEEWEKAEPEYIWKPIYDDSQLQGALLVAVHPRLVRYSSETGFQLGVVSDGSWQSPIRKRVYKRGDRRYTYQQETYAEHIAGLYEAYENGWRDVEEGVSRQPLKTDTAYAFAHFEARQGWPPGTLDKLARFVIAGHDLGKLGQHWQAWAHRWQVEVDRVVNPTVMLAHTDYDASPAQEELQKTLKREIGSRPPHAAESAFGLFPASYATTGQNLDLLRAVNSVMACHHSATHQGGVQTFAPAVKAQTALEEAFELVGLGDVSLAGVKWSFHETKDLRKYLVEANSSIQMLAYLLLVRVLRLADQRSQA